MFSLSALLYSCDSCSFGGLVGIGFMPKSGIKPKVSCAEEAVYERILSLISTIPEGGFGQQVEVKLQRAVFKSLLDKIYKRQK